MELYATLRMVTVHVLMAGREMSAMDHVTWVSMATNVRRLAHVRMELTVIM